MPAVTTHPTADQLLAFFQGRLRHRDWVVVEGHVQTCPDCALALHGLPDDRLASLARGAHVDPAGQDETIRD